MDSIINLISITQHIFKLVAYPKEIIMYLQVKVTN